MWDLKVHAYCLMSNHYHLLVETPQGNLSRCLRHLDGIYTQRYNRAHHTDGSLFRGRYKAILIDADSYLLQLVRYIHLNPVEGKIVRSAEGYQWSSHRNYLGKGKSIQGLEIQEVLRRFHTKRKVARELYKEYIQEGIDGQTQGLYKRGNMPSVWGSESFREGIKERIRKMRKEDEIPEIRRVRGVPGIKEVEERVCERYGIERKEMRKKRRGYWNEPRNVAIYLSRSVGGVKLTEIGNRWGGLHYSSVSGMMYEVKKRMAEDKGFRRRVEGVEHSLINQQK